MPRSRIVKPSFFKNEELAELHPYAQLLFIGLWTLADCEGRLEDRPKRISAEIFPYGLRLDASQTGVIGDRTEEFLQELHWARFIYRYRVGGHGYIFIPKFKDHQHIHVNERAIGSKVPAPDQNQFMEWISTEEIRSDPEPDETSTTHYTGYCYSNTVNPIAADGDGDTSLFAALDNPPFDPTPKPEPPLKAKQRRWFNEQVWSLCWRKVDKQEAFKQFCKVCHTEGDLEHILNAMKAHGPVYLNREPEHRPYLATWFRKGRHHESPEDGAESSRSVPAIPMVRM